MIRELRSSGVNIVVEPEFEEPLSRRGQRGYNGEIVMELSELQRIKGLNGKTAKLLVSAMTTPMDEFA